MNNSFPISNYRNVFLNFVFSLALALLLFNNIFAQPNQFKDDGINGGLHQKFAGKIVFSKENLSKEELTEAKITNDFTLGDLIYFRVFMKRSMLNSLLEKEATINQSDVIAKSNYKLVFSLDGGKNIETNLDFGSDATEKKQWTSWRGSLKHTRSTGILGMDTFREFLAESNISNGKHNVKLTIYPAYKELRGEPITGEFTLNVNSIDTNDSSSCLPKAGINDQNIEKLFIQAYKTKGFKDVPRKVIITSEGWTVEKNKVTGRIESRKSAGVIATNTDGKCIYQYFWVKQDYNGSDYAAPYISLTGEQTKINCGCLK